MSNSFNFTKPVWDLTKDKKVYETPVFDLHEKHFNPPDQVANHPYYVIHAPDWINVIALTNESPKKIILVEQFRAGICKPTLEIPGGMIDDGETPQFAAKRELLEETGFESESWTSLGKVSSNPAILTNYTHLYFADNCTKITAQHTDESEDIDAHTLPLDEFLNLVRDGTVNHSIVVAAVGRFLLHKKHT